MLTSNLAIKPLRDVGKLFITIIVCCLMFCYVNAVDSVAGIWTQMPCAIDAVIAAYEPSTTIALVSPLVCLIRATHGKNLFAAFIMDTGICYWWSENIQKLVTAAPISGDLCWTKKGKYGHSLTTTNIVLKGL